MSAPITNTSPKVAEDPEANSATGADEAVRATHGPMSDSSTTDGSEGDDEPSTDAAGTEQARQAGTGGARSTQLEREGEIAADFLETLLDIADLDGDLEVDIDGDRAAVSIVDSEDGTVPRRLVGSDGEIVEALQELARLSVQAETGERSRLMLDVGGYRAERRATVLAAAQGVIAEVSEHQERRAMTPMTAYERKVVHDEVLKAGLRSESEGEEPGRHVVVLPAS